MIDRIHLSILNEIDRNGTLTAAAQALCLTQPALTHTMKKTRSRHRYPAVAKKRAGGCA